MIKPDRSFPAKWREVGTWLVSCHYHVIDVAGWHRDLSAIHRFLEEKQQRCRRRCMDHPWVPRVASWYLSSQVRSRRYAITTRLLMLTSRLRGLSPPHPADLAIHHVPLPHRRSNQALVGDKTPKFWASDSIGEKPVLCCRIPMRDCWGYIL